MTLRILSSLLISSLFLLPAYAATTPKELLAAGRVDEAIQTLQQQIARSASDAEGYNLLCRAYFMAEEWDRGIAACERARDLDPQKSIYYLWLGRIYGEKADRAGPLSAAGLAKKIRISFERAVELDPGSWDARADLAEFYVEAPGIVGGGRDKAEAQAKAIAPQYPAVAHWIGARIAAKRRDAASAEREYRAAIAADPTLGRAWVDLASLLLHNNRTEDMEQVLRGLETAPVAQREALMDGASVLLRSGLNYPLAVRLCRLYLETPVEKGPAFRAHDDLGLLLEKQGDRHGAAEEFRAALSLFRGYTRAQEDLKRVEH
jgi:tetratricopeptide (TPR) repeat protein